MNNGRDHLDAERRKRAADFEKEKILREQEAREAALMAEIEALKLAAEASSKEHAEQIARERGAKERERDRWEAERAEWERERYGPAQAELEKQREACNLLREANSKLSERMAEADALRHAAEAREVERDRKLVELQEVCFKVGAELSTAREEWRRERAALEGGARAAREESDVLRMQLSVAREAAIGAEEAAEKWSERARILEEERQATAERDGKIVQAMSNVLEEVVGIAECVANDLLQGVERDASEAEEKERELTSKVKGAEMEREELGAKVQDMSLKLQGAQEDVARLEKALAQRQCRVELLEGECERARKAVEEALASKAALSEELECERIGRIGTKAEQEEEMARLRRERDAVSTEKDAVIGERDALLSENSELVRDRDAVSAEKDAVIGERDALLSEKSRVVMERDALEAECSEVRSMLDATVALAGELEEERNEERSRVAHLQGELEEIDGLYKQALEDCEKAREDCKKARGELEKLDGEALSRAREGESESHGLILELESMTRERNMLSDKLRVALLDADQRKREGGRWTDMDVAEDVGNETRAAAEDVRVFQSEMTAMMMMGGHDNDRCKERGREAGEGGWERGTSATSESERAEAERMRQAVDKMRMTAERDLAQGGLLSDLALRTNESVRRGREEARRSLARCKVSLQQVGCCSNQSAHCIKNKSARLPIQNLLCCLHRWQFFAAIQVQVISFPDDDVFSGEAGTFPRGGNTERRGTCWGG